MADGTKIEWADATLNYINGCSLASPGCTNCYAMKQAHRFPVRQGLTTKTKGGMVWTGEVREHPKALEQALAWKRGRAIFWNAHGDLFHESVPDEWIDRQFAVMALTPQHRHMVLTKRSARMREYMTALTCDSSFRPYVRRPGWKNPDPRDGDKVMLLNEGQLWPLANVWLGVSVEDQTRADERIPDLLATPAAVRFISAEPLLGPIDLTPHLHDSNCGVVDEDWPTEVYARTCTCSEPREVSLDWVIAGGESGSGARPMHPDWARSLHDQCAAAGVAFHFKQWGEWAPSEAGDRCISLNGCNMPNVEPNGANGDGAVRIAKQGKKRAGRLLDGVTHDGVPPHV